jgi:hypothetical protein
MDDTKYTAPVITDYGTVTDFTAATGTIGSEDGVGKTIQAGHDAIGQVSVGVVP